MSDLLRVKIIKTMYNKGRSFLYKTESRYSTEDIEKLKQWQTVKSKIASTFKKSAIVIVILLMLVFAFSRLRIAFYDNSTLNNIFEWITLISLMAAMLYIIAVLMQFAKLLAVRKDIQKTLQSRNIDVHFIDIEEVLNK